MTTNLIKAMPTHAGWGIDTTIGLPPTTIHVADKKRYDRLEMEKMNGAYIRTRPSYRKGVDCDFINPRREGNHNSFIIREEINNESRLRANMYNRPLVQPDFMSLRQIPVKRHVYTERLQKAEPLNIEQLTHERYGQRQLNRTGVKMSTELFPLYFGMGRASIREVNREYKKQAHTIHQANASTREDYTSMNRMHHPSKQDLQIAGNKLLPIYRKSKSPNHIPYMKVVTSPYQLDPLTSAPSSSLTNKLHTQSTSPLRPRLPGNGGDREYTRGSPIRYQHLQSPLPIAHNRQIMLHSRLTEHVLPVALKKTSIYEQHIAATPAPLLPYITTSSVYKNRRGVFSRDR